MCMFNPWHQWEGYCMCCTIYIFRKTAPGSKSLSPGTGWTSNFRWEIQILTCFFVFLFFFLLLLLIFCLVLLVSWTTHSCLRFRYGNRIKTTAVLRLKQWRSVTHCSITTSGNKHVNTCVAKRYCKQLWWSQSNGSIHGTVWLCNTIIPAWVSNNQQVQKG